MNKLLTKLRLNKIKPEPRKVVSHIPEPKIDATPKINTCYLRCNKRKENICCYDCDYDNCLIRCKDSRKNCKYEIKPTNK